MNKTEIIINHYGVANAYKIYAAISSNIEIEVDSETILDRNTEEINIDKDIFTNTLLELEYKESIIIDLMMQTIANDDIKEKIKRSHDSYYDYYMDIYYECVKCYYDIDVIGQYLIKLASNQNEKVNSELINKILCNNVNFKYMTNKDKKYYATLTYKLQSYDISLIKLKEVE